jgi:hypothetical protein
MGAEDYPSTEFDLNENDRRYMNNCHVAVPSAVLEALIT